MVKVILMDMFVIDAARH